MIAKCFINGNILIINKTFDAQQIELKAEDPLYQVEVVGDQNWTLEGQSKFDGRFFLVKKLSLSATEICVLLLLLLLQETLYPLLTILGKVN